jgi:hypothetical protein
MSAVYAAAGRIDFIIQAGRLAAPTAAVRPVLRSC